MSKPRIDLSPDLKRLRDEGYDIDITPRFLLVRSVPYVNARREVSTGTLVMELKWAADVTVTPENHVAYFIGDPPCHENGQPMSEITTGTNAQALEKDLVINATFSAKPIEGPFPDFYLKVKRYVLILTGPAKAIDPTVKADVFPVIENTEGQSVFNYVDTASSRAGIAAATAKLETGKIAIVGVGGTGSYILDYTAKTPIPEIHLFDGDRFLNHNAFRSPGAPSLEELRTKPFKAEYFQKLYLRMRSGIFTHTEFITEANVEQLRQFDFVFLSMDGGPTKRLIVEKLQEWGVPFIDVGMGLNLTNGSIGGILAVTTSAKNKTDHVKARIPFFEADKNNDYSKNIQIGELNALNAALAVLKWKKMLGFYHDFKHEHFSAYTLGTNRLDSEDRT